MAVKRRNGEGSYGEKTINGTLYKYYRTPEGKYFTFTLMRSISSYLFRYHWHLLRMNFLAVFRIRLSYYMD